MGDGSVRHIHANKIRKFVARVQGSGVIVDDCEDFGDVCTPATNTVCSSDLPSSRIEDSKLKHLDSCQRDELLHLLDEFSDCLTDKPGLCGVASNSNNVLLYTTSDIAISRSRTSDERSRSADS